MSALTVSKEEEKRLKGQGFLNNRGTDEFSARVITVNGKVTAAQHRCMAEAAEKFGNGNLTYTTRLSVEVQGIPYEKIEEFQEFIAKEGLETGGTGAKVRPVVSCKGTTCQYGLLGLMTALPTTSKFLSYQQVYFPKNPFIREEVMNTRAYLNYFFPFTPVPLTIHPGGGTIDLPDQTSFAIMMTYHNEPEAMALSFMRGYSERYDWLISIFRDWAFTFVSAFLYYKDMELAKEPEQLRLYQRGIAAFEGNALTYHMELRDKPTIVWDFHSLLAGIKLMLSFRLTDDQHPLRLCEQCQRAFIGKRKDSKFCSVECRRKWTAEHPGV